jgi:selenocysteine lyase/cysteine desulfurase
VGHARVIGLHRAPSSRALNLADAQSLWSPSGIYLNTPSYGLPPQPGWDDLQAALADWHGGRTGWQHWGDPVETAREAFAALVRAERSQVAIGATVSGLVGLVASSLPEGARVVVPDIEFTSTLFPFLVQPGLEVRTVEPAQLAEAIDEHTDFAAFSAVQMATGEVADLDAITRAAATHGVRTLVDATQAAGWLPLDATRFDFLVAAAYKWLMSPRGTAFMVVAPERLDGILPSQAGWYAGEDVHDAYSGPPLRLASDARRLDTSPAWFSWVGTAPAIELINEIGIDAIHEHDVGLANRFRAGLGLEPSNSAIVSTDHPGGAARLEAEGIRAAEVLGRLRTGWHVYNTKEDADRAVDVLQTTSG